MALKKIMDVLGKILLHPVAVLTGIAAGVAVGIYDKPLAAQLSKPGDIYLGLLQMCVLPLMISAIILSVGRLLHAPQAGRYVSRLFVVFVAGMILASVIGLAVGLIGKPGLGLDKQQKIFLGKEISRVERIDAQPAEGVRKDLWYFVSDMIPRNVFRSMNEDKNLPVLFFCLVIGVALGLVRSDSSVTALAIADATYEALLKIVAWLMYGMPFGICFLLADQIARIGPGVLSAVGRLVALMYVASLILLALYVIVIWVRSRRPFLESLVALRRPFIVAVGTSSSFAALPFALEGLTRRLRFEKETVGLIIPLGFTLNPQGNIVCFSLMAVFMAQLYDVPMTVGGLSGLVFVSIMAGVAASSAPGVAALSMLALVLEPFSIPAAVGVILITAINPIIDPILTAVNVYGNCATASMVANRVDNAESDEKSSSLKGTC